MEGLVRRGEDGGRVREAVGVEEARGEGADGRVHAVLLGEEDGGAARGLKPLEERPAERGGGGEGKGRGEWRYIRVQRYKVKDDGVMGSVISHQ